MLTLVLGGSRSGKSEVAEQLASRLGSRVVYIATGQAWDEEMKERIERHRQRRDPAWTTVEEPLDLLEVVRQHGASGVCLLVDGLGTWVSNLLLAERSEPEILAALTALLAALEQSGAGAVVVSDEVGLGLVPTSSLGRQFRDALGLANQQVASWAAQVLLVVAGIAIDLKALEVKQ